MNIPEIIFYFEVVTISLGYLIFIYSEYKLLGLIRSGHSSHYRKYWIIMFILYFFIMVGFLGCVVFLTGPFEVDIRTLLLPLSGGMFLFGAVLFYLSIWLITGSITRLNIEHKNRLNELSMANDSLSYAKEDLEKEVSKRTLKLTEKIEELEKLNKVMIGREVKMAELKEEILSLKGKNH